MTGESGPRQSLLNSNESGLARLLLRLANYGTEGPPKPIVDKISQETLAKMIGTTTSRVNMLMKKFRKQGFIAYDDHIQVHQSLLNAVLKEGVQSNRQETADQIDRTNLVIGGIVNVLHHKPPTTLEQANVRLQLLRQIVLEALRDVKDPAFFGSKGFRPLMPRPAGDKQRTIRRQSPRPDEVRAPALIIESSTDLEWPAGNTPSSRKADLRVVPTNGVDICTQAFGDPKNPTLLLITGSNSSMTSWPDNYCRLLAAGGRFVIRYDERDTGQSTSFEPYKPPYTLSDLAKDAIGVLDGYGVQRAHVCGISEGGMVVQHLTLDHSNRLLSAIIQSSSPEPNGIMGAATGQIESWVLPPPLPSIIDLTKMLTTVDWHDPVQAVGAWVTESSAMCGNDYPVDEDVALTLAREEVHRARNIVSQRFNHTIAIHNTPRWRHRLASVRTRTLVLHGSADPCFPIAHAKALAREIPQANLLVIEGMGHDVFPRTWTKVATAALEHTDH